MYIEAGTDIMVISLHDDDHTDHFTFVCEGKIVWNKLNKHHCCFCCQWNKNVQRCKMYRLLVLKGTRETTEHTQHIKE